MKIEHKYISLAEFKAIEDGPGGFAGYMSKHGELDDGGDIVAKGAHLDTIPQFLQSGFATNNHDWTFGNMYGYPITAFEDNEGTWVEMRFHSTPDAQQARIKSQERLAAGLDVRMSIGYQPAMPPLIIEPKDYATEIPKWSKPAFVAANIEKAGRFPFVRILLKNDLYEGALVSVPMLATANVQTVKSQSGDLPDGLTLEDHSHSVLAAVKEYADREADLTALRTKEGRPISEARRTRIAKVVDALSSLDEIRDELRALLEETAPKDADDEESKSLDINAVLNYLTVMDLQLKGVPIK